MSQNKLLLSDIRKQLAERLNLTQDGAKATTDALESILEEAFLKGQSVAFGSLGTFKPADRAARKGRNPQTGESIDIAASKSVRFTVSERLKQKLNA